MGVGCVGEWVWGWGPQWVAFRWSGSGWLNRCKLHEKGGVSEESEGKTRRRKTMSTPTRPIPPIPSTFYGTATSADEILRRIRFDTESFGMDYAMGRQISPSVVETLQARSKTLGTGIHESLLFGIDPGASRQPSWEARAHTEFGHILELALAAHCRDAVFSVSLKAMMDLGALLGVGGTEFVLLSLKEMEMVDYERSQALQPLQPRLELLEYLAPTQANVRAVFEALRETWNADSSEDPYPWHREGILQKHGHLMDLFGWLWRTVSPRPCETWGHALVDRFGMKLHSDWASHSKVKEWWCPHYDGEPLLWGEGDICSCVSFGEQYPPAPQILSFCRWLQISDNEIPGRFLVGMNFCAQKESMIPPWIRIAHALRILDWITSTAGQEVACDLLYSFLKEESAWHHIDLETEADLSDDIVSHRQDLIDLASQSNFGVPQTLALLWLNPHQAALGLASAHVDRLRACVLRASCVARWRRLRHYVRVWPILLFWTKLVEERMCHPTGSARLFHDAVNRGDDDGAKRARADLEGHYFSIIKNNFAGRHRAKAEAVKLAQQRIDTLT